jgi:hypothetical protein
VKIGSQRGSTCSRNIGTTKAITAHMTSGGAGRNGNRAACAAPRRFSGLHQADNGPAAAEMIHTDKRMTEKHYAHLAPSYIADTIRAHFPTLGIGVAEKTCL